MAQAPHGAPGSSSAGSAGCWRGSRPGSRHRRVAAATRRGRGHRDSAADPARPRRQGGARGAGPGMAGRRRRGDLPHRPPRLPAGGRDARAPGGDSLCRRAAQDDLRKPRGRSRERGSLPRRGERQSHLSARDRPAVTGDGGGAEPSPRRERDRARPAGAAGLHRLRESGDASSIRDAPSAVARLAHAGGIPGPRGVPRGCPRAAAAPAPRRPARPDLPAGRNGPAPAESRCGGSSAWRRRATISSS